MSLFISAFAQKLDAMLDNRVACGFKRETHVPQLVKFDRYCDKQFHGKSDLTSEIVHSWLESALGLGLHDKSLAIRQFGKFLCATAEEAYVLPEKFAPGRRAKTPYIFTDDEISALFASIDRLDEMPTEPYISYIAPVLFRLIYTCGLRPNEGRELLCKNVNLDNGEIFVTNTKKNKERIVVMSDDMQSLCRKYDLQRSIFADGSPYMFPSVAGNPLKNDTLYATLNKAWKEATRTLGNLTPTNIRIYDLRHRFASACLNRWLGEGENLVAMLPYLRAYMGHGSLSETAYYIHILPENLAKTNAVDWDAFNSMFPDVPSVEVIQ